MCILYFIELCLLLGLDLVQAIDSLVDLANFVANLVGLVLEIGLLCF